MITFTQAVTLGLIQGITELFPISSLGHSIIIPAILGWHLDQNASYFLIFLVATHLATSLVLFGFFFKDWMRIIGGVLRSIKLRDIEASGTYGKLGWLIVVATIPAGILGLLFQDTFKKLFSSPLIVSIFLIGNGILLYSTELFRRKASLKSQISTDEKISSVSWGQSVVVGFSQSLALIPGFSRTGAALSGGLWVGLDHEAAARFSFLLATPIIFAAALLELPGLFTGNVSYLLMPVITGFVASAVAAYLSVAFLSRYFKTKTLVPFAIYSLVAGVAAAFILFLK